MSAKTDTRSYDELLTAARTGDATITAAQLADAKARSEHDALLAEGERFLADQARLADLEAEREQFRVDFARRRDEALAAGRAAYRAMITDAHQQLVDAAVAYNDVVAAGRHRARELGLVPDEINTLGEPVNVDRVVKSAANDAAGNHNTTGSTSRRGGHVSARSLRRHLFTPPEWADALDAQWRAEAEAWAAPHLASRPRPPAAPIR